jgi:RimJ/RimL family protein N-acetyltransferase
MASLSILVTERLLLRPAQPSHLPWFHRVWTDPVVRRHLWQGRCIGPDESARTLETCLSHAQATGLGLWRIHLLDETPIGFFGFWPRADERKPDVFMGLLPEFWKQGYGAEAGQAVFAHVFHRGYADEVLCSVAGDNYSSQRMMRRIGMVFVTETGKPGCSTRFYRLDAALLEAAGPACLPPQESDAISFV